MTSYNLNDYTKLSFEVDIKPAIVDQKLERLVGSVPDKFRPQIDRCLSMGFSNVLLAMVHSEAGGLNRFPYFTEDTQTQGFHRLAFPIFCTVITYGGYLGQLIRINKAEPQIQDLVLESAERVFKYAKEERILPSMDRADLSEFRQSLQGRGNSQGDISLN